MSDSLPTATPAGIVSSHPGGGVAGVTFEELAASRRQWIADVLQPWCRRATRKALLQAEQEWFDIAGRVAPEFTLWLWAWSRFPDLYVEGLTGLDESFPVIATTIAGERWEGYPDARQSRRGQLVVVSATGQSPHLTIDELASVVRHTAAGAVAIP